MHGRHKVIQKCLCLTSSIRVMRVVPASLTSEALSFMPRVADLRTAAKPLLARPWSRTVASHFRPVSLPSELALGAAMASATDGSTLSTGTTVTHASSMPRIAVRTCKSRLLMILWRKILGLQNGQFGCSSCVSTARLQNCIECATVHQCAIL